MSLVDPPDVLEQGLVGLSPLPRVGGTGSISTRAIDEATAAEAERRRAPVGFAAPERSDRSSGLTEFIHDAAAAAGAERAGRLERELRDLGECLWTARDTIVVYSDARGGSFVGRP